MMKIEKAFEILREHYGSHLKAAKALKICPRQYVYDRKPGKKLPPMKHAYIIMCAEKVMEGWG